MYPTYAQPTQIPKVGFDPMSTANLDTGTIGTPNSFNRFGSDYFGWNRTNGMNALNSKFGGRDYSQVAPIPTPTVSPSQTVSPNGTVITTPSVAQPSSFSSQPLQIGTNPNQSLAPTVFSEIGIGKNPNQSLAPTELNKGYGFVQPDPLKPMTQSSDGFFANWTGQDFIDAGQLGLNVINSGVGNWLGMQQLDLAKDQYNFQRDAFNKNYAAQAATTNNSLWRQYAKGQASAGKDYMTQEEWEKQGGGISRK